MGEPPLIHGRVVAGFIQGNSTQYQPELRRQAEKGTHSVPNYSLT